jgi:hypothetical protein
MTLRRSLILVVPLLLACGGPAVAQFAPPQQQEPPCLKDFLPLRDDAEKKAQAIRAASERKATPKEACSLFNALAAAEAKLVKFSIANATWCGIPPQAVEQMKTSHARTDQMRVRVCQMAANPQRPATPSLGDALGTTVVPDASTIKPGRGTFDTLTGTPLGGK